MADRASKDKLDVIKEGYKNTFVRDVTPTISHHIQTMLSKHDSLIRKSQSSNDPYEAFGLLKEASGIMKVLDHIKTNTGIELSRD